MFFCFIFRVRHFSLRIRWSTWRQTAPVVRIYLKVMKALHTKALATVISVALYSAAFLGMAAFIEQHHGCQNRVRTKGFQEAPTLGRVHRFWWKLPCCRWPASLGKFSNVDELWTSAELVLNWWFSCVVWIPNRWTFHGWAGCHTIAVLYLFG